MSIQKNEDTDIDFDIDKFYPNVVHTMEEILSAIEKIFNTYKIEDIFRVINALVLENACMEFTDPRRISPKIINRLFYIYERNISEPKNETINFNQVKESLRAYIIEATNLIYKNCMKQHHSFQKIDNYDFKKHNGFLMQTYINYFFDYADITKPQYIHSFLCNKIAIEQIFNNRITLEEILKGMIICINFEGYESSNIYIAGELNDKYNYNKAYTSFPIDKLRNRFRFHKVNENFIDIFFKEININKPSEYRYFTSKVKNDEFYLGIKTSDRVFFNRSAYAIDEFWSFIVENKSMVGSMSIS